MKNPERANVAKTVLKIEAVLLLATLLPCTSGAQEVPVDLPDGFAIRKVAGNDLVPDASAMTVDSGVPVVSGPGYVRRLMDSDVDGVFDSFQTLAEPDGIAQGLCFDGDQLWLCVDGAVKRSVSRKIGEPYVFEEVVPISTDKEHGSHAIRKGPDGWWYVICGNATEIRSEYYALASSPVKNPRAGFLMRFPPDVETGNGFKGEIVCHGFRNAYDFDFGKDGSFLVYDSDGERDISLPWYRPTRVFEMKPGDDAGWVSASWKRPAKFPDMPKLIGELGRGSPTGVAVCKSGSRGFGSSYEGCVFVGDWTFGRIGASHPNGGIEVFAKPRGNFGFAITDLEFSQDGSLFLTTGGRGTEGSLYQIQRQVAFGDHDPEPIKRKSPRYFDPRPTPAGSDFVALSASEFADRLAGITGENEPNVYAKVRRLQVALGGCDGDRMFAGHQSKSPLKFDDAQKLAIASSLLALLNRGSETFEVARLIGMLEPNNGLVANSLADVARYESDPVQRIHFLNCLAVAGGKLDSNSAANVADALLRVRREIDSSELPVDRNWAPRMQQLAHRLFGDMRIAEAIVNDATFGGPSDMWIYDSLPEIFKELARTKIATRVEDAGDVVSRQQLQAISVNPKYLNLLRSFSGDESFADLIAIAVSTDPTEEDRVLLNGGLRSFNLTVNKACVIALRKLGRPDDAPPIQFQSFFDLERRLGWTNPEISVRDQIVLLLRKWSGAKDLTGYELRAYGPTDKTVAAQAAAMMKWARSVGVEPESAVASIQQRMESISDLDFSIGNDANGELAYRKHQCSTCHNGRGQNSGPSLAGITSRFSREDIFRAIIDPNSNVPDRYRAIVVATEDGELYRGSVVYESMAGIMLSIGAGEVIRIDSDNIESRRKSKKSLMPEGLLDKATDEEIVDLWAYLKTLK